MSIHKLCISLPYLVNQIFPFQYFSSVFTQHSKELLFCLTKFNRFSIFEKFHFIEIELKSIKLHRILSCCLFISKLHRHSCTQNHQAKRFRNIIICPSFQSCYNIYFHVIYCKQNNRHLTIFPYFSYKINPIPIRQIHI